MLSLTRKRVALCIHCGHSVEYVARAPQAKKAAWVAMKRHERECPDNPLVAELKALTAQAVPANDEGCEPIPNPSPMTFTYTNWQGKTTARRATPRRVYWGSSHWHPEPQWLMEAFDHDKQAIRAFALRDMAPASACLAGLIHESLDRRREDGTLDLEDE